jgi:isoleucyl-tRNA synthetase
VTLAAGVIQADGEVVCPVDATGRFVEPVKDFLGEYVKDADKHIIKKLKEMGRLVHAGQTKHSYPFCWRSDTPLLYKAVPSWFMRVSQMQDLLLEKLRDTYWVPETIKDGLFANWLENAKDWNLSR